MCDLKFHIFPGSLCARFAVISKMIATLYDVETHTINYHIKRIFADSELEESSVIRNFRITAADEKTYNTKHYALQMIIALGFKVNSERAVQFRKWVNQIAKDYTIKGWVMDDERIKRGSYLTDKYFEEQLERIREIRASERKFYQKLTDLYATAIDYDKNAKSTKRFYATVRFIERCRKSVRRNSKITRCGKYKIQIINYCGAIKLKK